MAPSAPVNVAIVRWWLPRIKTRAVAMGGFLLCLLAFVLGPEIAAQTYSTWRTGPLIAHVSFDLTVRFAAMPDDFRGHSRFDLASVDQRAHLRCSEQATANGNGLHPVYRCNVSQRYALSESVPPSDYFPAAQGWRSIELHRGAVSVELPPDDDALPDLLFILLLAGLYWRIRTFAPDRHGSSVPVALGWCVLVLTGTHLVSWGLNTWYPDADADAAYMAIVAAELHDHPWLAAAGYVAIAPVMEELIFRGVGWRILQRGFSLPVVAVLTSVVFAVIHGYSWVGTLSVLACGFGLALIRARTGSIVWCIATHATMNAMALAAIHYGL